MEVVLASLSISISELRKDPARVLREAGQRPVAVLDRNKPAFYLVEPQLFEALVELQEDMALAEIAAKRIATSERSVGVNLDGPVLSIDRRVKKGKKGAGKVRQEFRKA